MYGASEWLAGRCDGLVWVVFNWSSVQVTMSTPPHLPKMVDAAMCHPHERLAYLHPKSGKPAGAIGSLFDRLDEAEEEEEPTESDKGAHLVVGTQPPHPSAILFLPSLENPLGSIDRFQIAFGPIGEVVFDLARFKRWNWRRAEHMRQAQIASWPE